VRLALGTVDKGMMNGNMLALFSSAESLAGLQPAPLPRRSAMMDYSERGKRCRYLIGCTFS
jgi:hypothetical protein